MQTENPSPEEFEEVLALIHRTALAYEGPHAAAFAQIARCSRAERIESDERDEMEIEPREPQEKFAEALSLLLKIVYPASRSDVARIMVSLGQTLGERIESLSMSDDEGDVIGLHETLPPEPSQDEREFEQVLRRFLPRHERSRGLEE